MWMSFHRSPGHTRMVEMVWPDTILNLAEASERLGNTWQVSKQQPWVWPVGEWGVGISSCHMGKKSAVGKRLLNSFKGFLCLPAGCIFCPLFCFVFFFFLVVLAGDQTTGLNVLSSCLSLPNARIMSISQQVWLLWLISLLSCLCKAPLGLFPGDSCFDFSTAFSLLLNIWHDFPSSMPSTSGKEATFKAEVLLESQLWIL